MTDRDQSLDDAVEVEQFEELPPLPSLPALPVVPPPPPGASAAPPPPPSPAFVSAADAVAAAGEPAPLTAAAAEELLAFYEREAKALGNEPAAARLHFEMGLLWEQALKNPRKAAVCYQNAYRLAPGDVENLEAARRLFADVGNWQMVAQLLDAEAAAAPDEAARAQLLLEKALILQDRLSKPDDALALLEQLADKVPGDVAVLSALEAACRAKGLHEKLAKCLEALGRAASDPRLRCAYLTGAAQLFEGTLRQPAKAAELYREALAIHAGDAGLLAAVKLAAEREGRPEEVLAALRAEAAAAPGETAAPVYYRLARVLERAGKPDEALDALLQGRRSAPRDPLILDALAAAFESAARWEELADVLHARLEGLTDQSERLAVELRLGALYEERLSDEEQAIACYRRVLAVAPTNASAVGALGKLYARRGNWQGLVETFEAEAKGADDPRQKAARLYKAAELLEDKLHDDERAIALRLECLQAQPDYLPAQKALVRTYERLERWDDLATLYEQDLAQTRDRDQTIAVLTRLAALHEERRKDLPRSVETLKRVLEVAHDHLPTIRALARLCERAGLWEELIRTNELEATLAGDAKQVISLRHSNAEIFEEQLKQKDKAVEEYRRVLQLSPNYLPALKALGRIYAQTGRWDDLVEMYRQEAEITPSPEVAASLLFKGGELLEEKLNRVDDAIAVYQEVLTLSPAHFPAMRSLSRIYRGQKAWESLVEILRAEAAARSDKAERANTLFQVAALWEDELRRPEMAIECYREVLELVPAHRPSARALERLYSAQGAMKELVDLLEAEAAGDDSPEAKVTAYEKLAGLFADRLRSPGRAEQCLEAILAIDPGHLGALKGLEALRAEDPARRAEVRLRLAAAVKEPKAAAAFWLAGVHDRVVAGDDSPQLEDLGRAAALEPGNVRVASQYERALRRAGSWEKLAAHLETQLGLAAKGEARRNLLMRLGEICEWHLGRFDRALAAYRAVLAEEPGCLAALRAARRLLGRGGSHQEVYRLLLAEGQACRDPRAAVEALLDAGRLAEQHLGSDEAARVAYQSVLARDPLDQVASDRLEALLAKTGGAAELAALHAKRARTRAASQDAKGAAEEFFAAAKIHAQLKDAPKALESLEGVLQAAPDHAEALLLKADLCQEHGRWPDAALALQRRLELGGDPRVLGPLHLRVGVLLQDQLKDPGRAAAHLQAALSVEPHNQDALERLGTLHRASRNWAGAADIYRRLIETGGDPQTLARRMAIFGQIAEEGFGDPNAAAAHYKRALDLTPNDSSLVDRLIPLYERLGNLGELAGLLELQALSAAGTGEKARSAGLRIKAADLYKRLGDLNKAVQMLRFACELAPELPSPRAALADLLTKDANTMPAAMEEHRHVLRLDPLRLESYHALYRLYANTRQLDRAVCTGHVIQFFKALTEAESASFSEARGRVPQDTTEVLGDVDVENVLQHPNARHPLSDVMRAIGDQLHKVVEPQLEAQGISKSDRLKADHPLHKMVKQICGIFGVEKFEVYQGKRGAGISLENTDPLCLIVGPDFTRRYNQREQRFLLGRAAYQLRMKLALALRLDDAALADLVGNAVRAVAPQFDKLGRPDVEMSKRIKKAMSSKALRSLEACAGELASRPLDVKAWLQAAQLSADRAGLSVCGDIGAGLQLLFREDPSVAGSRLESTEQMVAAVRKRRDMSELVGFVLSDDHFKIRARLRLTLL